MEGQETGELDFDQCVDDAIASLPDDLRGFMSNVAILVEAEPPAGQPLLGLYQGVPLTRRGSSYGGVLPDRITIYQGPLERYYGVQPGSAAARDPAGRTARDRASFRHQRRPVARARSLLDDRAESAINRPNGWPRLLTARRERRVNFSPGGRRVNTYPNVKE